jgi:hypothetical protein
VLMSLLLLRRLFLLLDLLLRLLLLLVVLCSSVLALWLLVLVLLLLSCKVDDLFGGEGKWDIQHTGCILVWRGRAVNTKTASPFQRYQKGVAALLLYHSRARFCIVEE